jgi:hypothetical protein
LDEYLSCISTNPEQQNFWKARVKKDNIKLYRQDAHNPDALLKICLTLMVTAGLEVHKGIAGLWQGGNSLGMKEYPNYGQYIPKEYFKAFLHGFPYLWAEKHIGMSIVLNFHSISLNHSSTSIMGCERKYSVPSTSC